MLSSARPTSAETCSVPKEYCLVGVLESETLGRGERRFEDGRPLAAGLEALGGGEAAVAGGLGGLSMVRVAVGLSVAWWLGGGDSPGLLLGKMEVSLRISVSRMGVTSSGMGYDMV
jgi:hypothetical protein